MQFLETPLDGLGYFTNPFGGVHGGRDYAGPHRSRVWNPGDCVAAYRVPEGSSGDGSFGNAVHFVYADGWHGIIAHLDDYDYTWPEGVPLPAGVFLGYQGYTGYTVPRGIGGSHIHWALCRTWPFPQYSAGVASMFADPGAYLISEAEKMALFQKLERVELMLGGEQFVNSWVNSGNVPIVGPVQSCLGPQPALLGQPSIQPEAGAQPNVIALVNSLAQTYGTNTVLLGLRPQLERLGVIWPIVM